MVCVGGAIEMITTGGALTKGAKKGHSSGYVLLGYVFHLGNTLCMVGNSSWCVAKWSCDVFGRPCMFYYKRNLCS